MQTKEWKYIDRSEFGSGPWDQEPDKIQFLDEGTGLPCIVRRNDMGALCGYVGVPLGHPAHGLDYGSVDADVHGGLTFSGACDGDAEHGICHAPDAGEPDNVWWLGFDCAHYNDSVPKMRKYGMDLGGTYKTVEYVKSECRDLAKQLRRMTCA